MSGSTMFDVARPRVYTEYGRGGACVIVNFATLRARSPAPSGLSRALRYRLHPGPNDRTRRDNKEHHLPPNKPPQIIINEHLSCCTLLSARAIHPCSCGQARLFHSITACRRSLSILRPYYLPSSFACFLHASFVLPPPIAAAIRDHLSGVSGPIFATAAFSFVSSAAVQLALPLPGADGGVAAALPAAAAFPAGVPPFAAAFGGGSGALFAFLAAAGGGAAAAGRFFPAAAPFGGGGSSSDSSSLSPSSSNSSSSSSSSSSCCVCVRWA